MASSSSSNGGSPGIAARSSVESEEEFMRFLEESANFMASPVKATTTTTTSTMETRLDEAAMAAGAPAVVEGARISSSSSSGGGGGEGAPSVLDLDEKEKNNVGALEELETRSNSRSSGGGPGEGGDFGGDGSASAAASRKGKGGAPGRMTSRSRKSASQKRELAEMDSYLQGLEVREKVSKVVGNNQIIGGVPSLETGDAVRNLPQAIEPSPREVNFAPPPLKEEVMLDSTRRKISARLEEQQVLEMLDQPANNEAEAGVRLESLVNRGEHDSELFAQACHVRGLGWCVPEKIRGKVWKHILSENVATSLDFDEVYSSDAGDKIDLKAKVLEDCIHAMGEDVDDGIKATAAHVVFQYCMRNKIEYVRAHADLGAIAMQAVFRGNENNVDGNLLNDCNILFDTLSRLWGGPTGNWSALIGLGDGGAYPAALGAAWCPWTKSVEAQTRRNTLFSLLLGYHDPQLARFVNKQAAYLIPAAFGILSAIDRDSFDGTYFATRGGSQFILSLESRTRVCDAIILKLPGFSCPQEACFFFSLGAFLLNREDILAEKYQKGDKLFPQCNDREAIFWGCKAASLTPASFREVLSEYELPLIPTLARSGIQKTAPVILTPNEQDAETAKNADSNAEGNSNSAWLGGNLIKGLTLGADLSKFGGSPNSQQQAPQQQIEPLVVEFNNHKPLGLTLVKQPRGLTVVEFSRGPDGSLYQAEESGKVSIGDLILAVNGVSVVSLTPSVASAVIQHQNTPYFIVFATMNKQMWRSDDSTPPQPLLRAHLIDLYQSFGASHVDKKADRVIKLYAGREAVLLNEILANYGKYLKGDPLWSSFSTVALPISVNDIIEHLCKKKGASEDTNEEQKFLFLDCRSQFEMNDIGRFEKTIPAPTDDADTTSRNGILKTILNSVSEWRPRSLNVCIIGSGTDAFYRLFDPKRARSLFQEDRRNVDNLAISLLSKGVPFVSVVTGGFVACLTTARSMGYSLEEVLVDRGAGTTMEAYEAYFKFVPGDPAATAEFITSASREFEPAIISSPQAGGTFEEMVETAKASAPRATTPQAAKSAGVVAESMGTKPPLKKQNSQTQRGSNFANPFGMMSKVAKSMASGANLIGSKQSSAPGPKPKEGDVISDRAPPLHRVDTTNVRDLFQIGDE